MRDADSIEFEQALQPPPRLYERLAQLSGYTWDQSIQPFHSTYDNWHVFGLKHLNHGNSGASSFQGIARTNSTASSPRLGPRPPLRHNRTASLGTQGTAGTNDLGSSRLDGEKTYTAVVARISTHILRIEREYHLCKSFIQTSDPDFAHTVKPLDLVRLPSHQGDEATLIVSIFESPGRNYLKDLLDLGPAFLAPRFSNGSDVFGTSHLTSSRDLVSLSTFLDFAIGACECLELLHHGLRVVHGELRADAFHFNRDSGVVKLINFGSGPRSFENGLTSSGWMTLSREIGVKHKLQYVAPEQTGRMPAEPNSRTDIYGLGVLFWIMLTGRPPFQAETPIDIIQAVLGRRIPLVSSERIDVPDVIAQIIEKMTQKQIDDRYHSTSGLKYDLIEVQRLLGEGDNDGLAQFHVGSKDVSSFFVLPTHIAGRNEERDRIVEVIEKVAKWQVSSEDRARLGVYAFGSTSGASTMSERFDGLETGTRSSDTSSIAGRNSENSPALGPYSSAQVLVHSPHDTTVASGAAPVEKPPLEANDSRESIQTTIALETQKNGLRPDSSGMQSHGPSQTPRRQSSHKSLRRRRCELISITGAVGAGKSSLIQSTQADIRRLGYFASSKFDPARKAPFEPLLRAMGSLFRQIFSESDVNSEYHNMVRKHIRNLWPSTCSMLDLPESLISTDVQYTHKIATSSSQQGLNKSIRAEIGDNSSVRSALSGSVSTGNHKSSDFLRGGANPRSLKFMTIFVEVLRILSTNKLICLCLDDIQFADEESLDLISQVILKKLGIVIITTCRDEETLSRPVETVLRNKAANLTTIKLSPLSEQDVVSYISATISRPPEYCLPLAAVCLEKSCGNPFYLRQMLEVCHRKSCIWYSWKESMWEYDLDRVFAEFESGSCGEQLNTDFITKRLQDLPQAARSILAWASLLGTTFSFKLIQRLLSGEFDYVDTDGVNGKVNGPKVVELFTPQPTKNVVEGLQATLQAYVLMPGSNEDEFSFSHDRYVRASASLRECHDVEKMHFIIVQTMMKYLDLDSGSLYDRARHICQSASVINNRVEYRHRFRVLLVEAAEKAIKSGARPTALQYYESCLALIQPKPWKEGVADAYYEETLGLYTKTAELYWHQDQAVEAQNLLDSIFAGARTASDKAPAWILQSKLFAQAGNMAGSFCALKTSLLELGLDLADNPTWASCDTECHELRRMVHEANFVDVISKTLDADRNMVALGAVLIEATSAAFWSNSILFYQLVLKMVETHMTHTSTFSQVGLGFSYFALVCIIRSDDLFFALQMHDLSKQFLTQHGDPYTLGRGLALSVLFIAHMCTPMREHFDALEEAINHSLVSGDKHVYLLSVGSIALRRLYIGDNMADIETFCSVAAEDFGDWSLDMRGGVFLTATRQVARSLQGKTYTESPEMVMSDEGHSTADYMELIDARSSDVERPRDIYNSLRMIPLYLYGHYQKAIQLSTEIATSIHQLWSMRISRLTMFYASLCLLAQLREGNNDQNRDTILIKVRQYKARIAQWQIECNANYLMWELLIEAELAEIEGRYGDAIRAYEAAIDHTQLHDFLLEQALAFELQGDFYVRRGARRAARAILKDSLAMYSRIGASGKVDQLTVKHEWVLRASATVQTRDVAIQTADTIGEIGNTQFRIEENERQETRNLGKETAGDRTQAWVSPTATEDSAKSAGPDVSDLGLDVLDLQSILEFNQAISSELQIDRLLAIMTEIILESAGAQADFAAVIIEGDNGWCIAASGTSEGISADAQPIIEIRDETQKQVLLYTMRFKEAVFVHNLAHDERFLIIGSAKSVISLPIIRGKDLLGVLYLEGHPNSFTDRNLGVLRLFCNQVGISIANALLFKRIAKVSASNTSMIESQKRALAKAREAEIKAKNAEAEAKENVRLKEEAAKVKSIFLANVSHELRTPLNGVIGMSELLKETPLRDEQKEFVNSIRVCADTLLIVINDILDYSKLEAGKLKLYYSPLNLKETIMEVVRALIYTNKDRGLETKMDLDLDPELLVLGDPVRLHQLFMNTMSNSYKFTKKGSVHVRAKRDYEDSESLTVTCSVADTGIGITQDQVSRLFTPFSQADSSTQREFGGSGLGLSICKALIEVMNGRISLESQLGVGTTVYFTVTFPKAAKTATKDRAPIAAQAPGAMATWSSEGEKSTKSSFFNLSQIPRKELRICIAEDNPINQKIAVSFVTKLGFKSEAYNDGLQAVEALRHRSSENNPFHLVLMDVQMPVLDGYDATRLIRADKDPAVRGVLIIAMTASAIQGDKEKCLEAGMNNYLAKPVRAAVLKSMLEDYLSQPDKPMPDLQSTAHDLATKVIKRAQNENRILPQPARPSFQKRMSSRNAIPYHGKDPQALLSPNEDTASTPRPTLLHRSSGNSITRVLTQDGLASTIEEDGKVPPLFLTDGAAENAPK
ncbi:MAG: hypothetical protein ALECFALPRED_009513 [Alectoria fallacina]|uniref:histidine kinase n=1 Tax=Alectoria fallacina TaxID=1903189 RepID=A0A8H3IHW5_9LECA|nr:MAG: hypothetical protein ALECFALPRED_009513 [Alectoria fallacina]